MSLAKLILIRGLPGSGKTTLAKQLVKDFDAKHFEADMYFENEKGEYHFNPSLLPQAHEWCFEQTRKWLNKGKIVIVSNTFVRDWEMKRYLDYCRKKSIEVEVMVCSGEYQSIHNVPPATIEKMRRQWQE
ncbi:AAA family ATPase [Vibrio parahaemolyticus]|nr:AAA family ATPase [Vibrio parahaemolyticus]EGR0929542.1 ATP-binding protein [Vibrio parahaemolyticus]EGR3232486.1 ATP-binding protein [Vibrio parahaemolyticus]EJG0179415.1 ATP-binding protein [Vibrio parahaemolyticus]EJM9300132.1 ATP-binding protein [Vibrio parahaemolyticus]